MKKEYKDISTNKKKYRVYTVPILLAIAFTALYYILREVHFLKDDKKANITGWNVLYFAMAIATPFLPLFFPPRVLCNTSD